MNNNNLIKSLALLLVVLVIFIGINDYQLHKNINELDEKIEKLTLIVGKIPNVPEINGEEPVDEPIGEPLDEPLDEALEEAEKASRFDNVEAVEYIKGVEKIEVNRENVVESVKELVKVENLLDSEIKEAVSVGSWEHGDIYKITSENDKEYTMRTYKDTIYGLIDEDNNIEKVVISKPKFKEVSDVQKKIEKTETYGDFEYIEYAVRFETPDVSEHVVEIKPHYVGYYVFEDANRHDENFMNKIWAFLRRYKIYEAYIYDSVELIEEDMANGDLDLGGYELAPNSVLHYTADEVTDD